MLLSIWTWPNWLKKCNLSEGVQERIYGGLGSNKWFHFAKWFLVGKIFRFSELQPSQTSNQTIYLSSFFLGREQFWKHFISNAAHLISRVEHYLEWHWEVQCFGSEQTWLKMKGSFAKMDISALIQFPKSCLLVTPGNINQSHSTYECFFISLWTLIWRESGF